MPNAIDAAFCSSKANECYIFVKQKYMVVNYAPGGQKKDIISAPTNIAGGFPMFANTIFKYKIDCSFDTGDNVAFFFSGDQCAKTSYTPNSLAKARLLQGPMPIKTMFPALKGTTFESGIDAILRSHKENHVHLFKGDRRCHFNFKSNTVTGNSSISKYFPPLLGTVFEKGIDAAFNTHFENEVFIFKDQYYLHYNIKDDKFLNGYIKLISDDWPALRRIL
ncbi:putative Hemopexin-like domain-containing protein [Medicago truncatula]|uniref:Albumin-2 protein n=1 Tax=Medicago truncatula TaxID=3880 RepID=A0A072U9L6_MEDTR|nr:albumin-2 [Medicago truncatula]KEH26121.1 albumin-2 protein [Medicago truncatula]RHN51363.1 putative Hemopexin-like domain-containing protein [Medicago truncatula]